MTSTQATPFGYEFVPGVSQYSSGVRAAADLEIVRVRLDGTPEMAIGFDRIERYLDEIKVPFTAVCAFELRSPKQFNEEEFKNFNNQYRERLNQWGVLGGEENPVARANVIPKHNKPSQPAVYAFSYVRPRSGSEATFIVSGSGEVPEGQSSYWEHIVARGDVSADGLSQKAEFVLKELERRLHGLGSSWSEVSNAQVYTVHNTFDTLSEIDKNTPSSSDISWHLCEPPIKGLDFEMDCRKTYTEYCI